MSLNSYWLSTGMDILIDIERNMVLFEVKYLDWAPGVTVSER